MTKEIKTEISDNDCELLSGPLQVELCDLGIHHYFTQLKFTL